ncbi:ATP-binding protein [Spinactinospora alkalitolerans]
MRRTSGWEWTSSAALNASIPQSWWLPALQHGALRWEAHRGPASHDSTSWSLEPDYGAVKVARELAMAVLREWGMSRMAGDVELVVSELVTNALRHAGVRAFDAPGCENVIQLSMMRRGGELICAVRDGSDQLPAQREPDFMAESGRGLHLVACFSRSWGAVPTVPDGKFVWALFT